MRMRKHTNPIKQSLTLDTTTLRTLAEPALDSVNGAGWRPGTPSIDYCPPPPTHTPICRDT